MTDVQSARASVDVTKSPEPFTATTRVTAGVAVLTLVGRLDASALPACSKAVQAALKVRTARAVVDLDDALLVDGSAQVLQRIKDFFARRGVTMTLVTASHESLSWLHETVQERYRVLPTVPLAVGVAAGTVPRQYVTR